MTIVHINLKLQIVFALALTSAGAFASEFEFRFWAAPGVEKDPRFVRLDDGPCGQVVTARVNAMPRYSKTELFAPERVLELNGRGAVIRQWVIPVDSTPMRFLGTTYCLSLATRASRCPLRAKSRRL